MKELNFRRLLAGHTTGSSDRNTYPDIVVVCGEPEFDDEQRDTLLNPTLIIEILSPSTEDYASLALADVYAQVDDLPKAARKPPEAAGSAPTLA